MLEWHTHGSGVQVDAYFESGPGLYMHFCHGSVTCIPNDVVLHTELEDVTQVLFSVRGM